MLRCKACMPLAALLAFSTSAAAGDPAASPKKPITTAQCEQLVKQLVNPEKPPFKEFYVEELPEDAKVTDQPKIKGAYDALSDNIEVALPVLVRHRKDNRFSYVYEELEGTSRGYLKKSVGGACREIIVSHVEVYRRYTTKIDATGIPRCPSFIYECGQSEKWWKERENKPLAAWQLEACEWVLRQRKPRLFESEQEWAEARKRVDKLAAQLRETNKPILVQHHVQFFSK